MSNQFLDLITKRRTIYAIAKNVEQSPEHLTDLIQTAIKQSPSSFNSQSSRAAILFNSEHEKFWGFVADKLKSYAKDEESAARTTAKMASFAAGLGTVLFFEDQTVIEGLQEQFPSYADNFLIWAEHSHHCSTTIRSWMNRYMRNGTFHRTGSCVHSWSLVR